MGVPVPLYADCNPDPVPVASLLARDAAAVVFSGTVTSIERRDRTEITSFRVERQWKGPATRQTVIYTPGPATLEATFVSGRTYVVIAHRAAAEERIRLGLAEDADGFVTDLCGDGSRPIAAVSEHDFRTLGPGTAPSDYQSPVRNPIPIPALKIKDAPPERPEGSRGIRGVVIVEITIDATGKVSTAKILRSAPGLEQAALDCVKKWEYLPALVNGVPAQSLTAEVVKFGDRSFSRLRSR